MCLKPPQRINAQRDLRKKRAENDKKRQASPSWHTRFAMLPRLRDLHDIIPKNLLSMDDK